MRVATILILILLKILYVQNRMLPADHKLVPININEPDPMEQSDENPHEKVIALTNYADRDDEYVYDVDRKRINEKPKKPCAVIVLSNIQNPTMQTLLRKYRYNSKGVLIPSSVRYFIKLPQGLRSSPLLVPLNDKAFSPSGGFVRYYKEVPPIPQSW